MVETNVEKIWHGKNSKIHAEKREQIAKATFIIFGKQGYRKASIADIAKVAGISKGMVSYYFGSKKNLYMHLLDIHRSCLILAVKDRLDIGGTDFFEKIKTVMELQVAAIRKYPGLLVFSNSAYLETDPEAANHFGKTSGDENAKFSRMFLERMDFSSFNPAFDPNLLTKFMFWASDGFSLELFHRSASAEQLETEADKYFRCLNIMRGAFNGAH